MMDCKHCTCCRRIHDTGSWRALPFRGFMETEIPGKFLELRDCSCGSTLAIPRMDLAETEGDAA